MVSYQSKLPKSKSKHIDWEITALQVFVLIFFVLSGVFAGKLVESESNLTFCQKSLSEYQELKVSFDVWK